MPCQFKQVTYRICEHLKHFSTFKIENGNGESVKNTKPDQSIKQPNVTKRSSTQGETPAHEGVLQLAPQQICTSSVKMDLSLKSKA